MDYCVTFQYREQYDSDFNCVPNTKAKSFPSDTTLEEVAEWVRKEAGYFGNGINLLSNPQITGIELWQQ